MEAKTTGTVISVTKQWWLKINTKPFRANTWDGAIFPHVIKIKYTVEGQEYVCRKWIPARMSPPSIGTQVTVFYSSCKPEKTHVQIDGL